MAITVGDCLKIGILKQASVVAGNEGLSRLVQSVTVQDMNTENWTSSDTLYGNELVLSSLSFVNNDINKQCGLIESLNNSGVSGLVIFYLGIYLETLSKKMLDMANILRFPIIVLPRKRTDFAYSDVINPITMSILNEQNKDLYLFVEVLNKMNDMQMQERNLKSVIKILGEKYNSSLIITNILFEPLEFYLNSEFNYEDILRICGICQTRYVENMHSSFSMSSILENKINNRFNFQVQPIIFENYKFGFLILTAPDKNGLIPLIILNKIIEIIKIYIRLLPPKEPKLNNEFNYVNMLINSQENTITPYTDGYLSFEEIDTIFVIKPLLKNIDLLSEPYTTKIYNLIKLQLIKTNIPNSITIQKDEIIILSALIKKNNRNETILQKIGENIFIDLKSRLLIPTIIGISKCITKLDKVYKTYNYIKDNIMAAKNIYPTKDIFLHKDISFSNLCLNLMYNFNTKISTESLEPLITYDKENHTELMKTLQIFLLDANSSIQEASKILYIHPNTMKYRLKRIEDIIGYNLENQPDQSLIMLYAAIFRCLNHKKDKYYKYM